MEINPTEVPMFCLYYWEGNGLFLALGSLVASVGSVRLGFKPAEAIMPLA